MNASTLAVAACLVIAPTAVGRSVGEEAAWPHWRGPDGTGMAAGEGPASWDDEGIKWSVTIPGRGCSTPVVAGRRLYVTTAVALGEAPEPEEPEEVPEQEGEGGRPRGGARQFHGGGGPQAEHSFEVHCLDRTTGETLWKQVALVATPHEGFHGKYGSHASCPPLLDGERLYASFGSHGVYCYELDGELVWKKDLGVKMLMRREFGEGTAPVVHGDALILNFDHEGDSQLVVLEKETGKERWRVARDEPSTWAPPLGVEVDGEAQIVVSGTNAVRAYALDSGEVVWECAGLGLNAIPAPLRAGDAVLVMTGYRNPKLMAIALGGKGDLTGTEAVLWESVRGTAYTPSPVLRGNEYYSLTDRGFLSAFDAWTGEPYYVEERLPRGLLYKASPVGAGDRLYVLSETGEVVIVRLGPEFEVLETLPSLGGEEEMFIASPMVVDGDLLLRSTERLYCIGAADGE